MSTQGTVPANMKSLTQRGQSGNTISLTQARLKLIQTELQCIVYSQVREQS